MARLPAYRPLSAVLRWQSSSGVLERAASLCLQTMLPSASGCGAWTSL